MHETKASRQTTGIPTKQAIRSLLNPSSIAFVGVSQSSEKMSGQAYRNVRRAGFAGQTFAVNQRGGTVDGERLYTSATQLPAPVDVAFVTVPAAGTPQALRELAELGTKVAVIAVGGFAETGTSDGASLRDELVGIARDGGIRLLGPVCNGVYNTHARLPLGNNVTHARDVKSGNVAFVSHSGALFGPFVETLEASHAGLSTFVSCGSEADLTLVDFVEYFAEDDDTDVIALVLDHVGDGSRFRTALKRARAAGKSVVALKLGDSDLGRQANEAHSSHLAGVRDVYRAIFRESGVIQVPSVETLAVTAAILSDGRRARNGGVIACSTSGGGAIVVADRFSADGLSLPTLAASTSEAIMQRLRFGDARIMNPLDLGLVGEDNYGTAIGHLTSDPQAGVLLSYGTMLQTPAKRNKYASAVISAFLKHPDLPVISLVPGAAAEDELRSYREAGVPVVTSVLDAITIATALVSTSGTGVAPPITDHPEARPEGTPVATDTEDANGPLSEWESKRRLADYGIVTPREEFVATISEAHDAARSIGFPVVLKASGRRLAHKTELGLVAVGLASPQELERTWTDMNSRVRVAVDVNVEGFIVAEQVMGGIEVIFGLTRDPEFGLVAVLGPGGIWAEIFGSDSMSYAVWPLTESSIRAMIDHSPLREILAGQRGKPPADIDALANTISGICNAASQLGDRLVAVDVNPILVREWGSGAVVLDALIVLGSGEARSQDDQGGLA